MALISARRAGGGNYAANRFEAMRTGLSLGLFAVLPLLISLQVALAGFTDGHVQSVDFGQEYWPAAARVLHGLDPYSLSWQHVSAGISFPYPALTALVFVPLALLPHGLADDLWTLASIASMVLALRLLKIRDWRLYGLVFVLAPILDAWRSANVTLLLCLGLALLWHYRQRDFWPALAAALLISLKPFMWPLGLWFFATRRYRQGFLTVGLVIAINLAAFAAVGPDEIHSFIRLSSLVTKTQYREGYTLLAFALRAGTSTAVAYAIGGSLAAAAAILAFRHGRRGQDLPAFAVTILVVLLATPVLWNHYLALLLVPLAIARKRLSPLWIVPLAWWCCPATPPQQWQVALAWLTTATVLCGLLRRSDGAVWARAFQAIRGVIANRLGREPGHRAYAQR